MKNYLFALLVSLLILSALSSCGPKGEMVYKCPMECEGDKTYDKPGKCPVCKMDLIEIQKSEIKKESGNEADENHTPDSGDSSHKKTN